MRALRFVPVTELAAAAIAEYRAAFPDDRARVTCDPARIPGLDRLECFDGVPVWLNYCRSIAGKITWYALTDGNRILGMLTLRHRLEYDDDDIEFASHIGYSVRPDERGRGYAKEMLRRAVPKAREIGIDRLRIICIESNTASRRTIEGCGGVLVDRITGEESGLTVCRYDIHI